MSLFHDSALVGSSGQSTGYQISRSLRFNSADSAYLSRTPASAGNRKTFTISLWVKRCKLGVLQSFISSANDTIFLFDANDKLCLYYGPGYVRVSTQVFRDVSAWYHLVLVVDTPNTTAQNRVRMYINNSEITAWDTNGTLTQNSDTTWNAALAHQIGANNTSQFPDQYIADFHNIDGQALTPSSFAETNATTGQWVPKAYSGSYGTNGFQLKFADNSAATATTLGKDTSGNGNNWTPNNLSVTAGAGSDSFVDSPTSYGTDTGVGGEVRGNYCMLNPLANGASTLSNGNLDAATTTTKNHVRGTIGVTSGKWYWECTVALGQDLLIGYVNSAALLNQYPGEDITGWSYYANNGNKYNGTATSYGASYTTGDVVGVAFDADIGSLTFYKNGTSQGVAFTGLTSGPYFPAVGNGGPLSRTYVCNFGQRPFAYTAPSGFKALCTQNLPAPTITKPSTVMDVLTWTGNGVDPRAITGLAFAPDMVWWKKRSATADHFIHDAVRGINANSTLSPNLTTQEQYQFFNSFDSNGFTVNNDTVVNGSGSTYVAWTWDAGSSTVTNTSGTISSQVRANASAGFSIVTYTGNNNNGSATVGHGLGATPQLIIVKKRSSTGNWMVGHRSTTQPGNLRLNTTDATITSFVSNAIESANSSTFLIYSYTGGVAADNLNDSGANYVAYCFAPVAGYSSFGSYTGNGSTDGPFVYTGFRPRWVMVKASSGVEHWYIVDTGRSGLNAANDYLIANSSSAETSYNSLFDFLSNGFKVRGAAGANNTNGTTYIYAAFAEFPFQYARAR